jgi:serine/threonine-protein kinase HipA
MTTYEITRFFEAKGGGYCRQAHDMNPCPRDINDGIYVLAINELEHTGSLEIAMSVAEYFGLRLAEARTVAGNVASAITPWRSTAASRGIRSDEIEQLSSAFQDGEIKAALAFKTIAQAKATFKEADW